MKKQVIAIASGDFHIHNFSNFNEDNSRLKWAIKGAKIILEQCKEYGVPLLFTGDLFHEPAHLKNEIFEAFENLYRHHIMEERIFCYAISGNHDMAQKNTLENISPSYLRSLHETHAYINCLDNDQGSIDHGRVSVWGVPYYNYHKDWLASIENLTNQMVDTKEGVTKNILLLHGDAPGAKLPSGRVIKGNKHALPARLDDYFSEWDLVLFGHIHKPQKLSDKCYMLGSPMQQITSDEGTEMGYWKVYSDMSMKFVPINHLVPEFISVKDRDQWELYGQDQLAAEKPGIPNYVIFRDEEAKEEETEDKTSFHVKKSRKYLSREYCKTKGITDKNKIKALTKILEDS